MTKGQIYKYTITLLLVASLTILFLMGFFKGLQPGNFISLLVLLLSISYFFYILISYFSDGRASRYDVLALGILFIIIIKALFSIIADDFIISDAFINFYPLDILLLIVLAYLHPLLNTFIYAAFISVIYTAYVYLNSPVRSYIEISYMVIAMFIAAIAVNTMSAREKRERKRLEGAIESMKATTKVVLQGDEDKSTAIAGISREEKQRSLLESANQVTESVTTMLKMLKKVINCNNCILFDVGKKAITVIGMASPDKDIIHVIPNESAGNLLGWIAEHKVPLRIAQIRDFKGISYYARYEGVNSFIGVPIFGEKDELKAILCADSKESDAFTQDTERLLIVAAHSISEFQKNIAVLREINMETREFTAFYDLSKELGATFNLNEILDIAISRAKEIVDYDMAAFILGDKENPSLLKIVSAKGLKAADIINKTFKLDESVAGSAVKNSNILHFRDYQEGKKDFQIFPGIFLPIRSLVCLPLIMKDETIGVFVIASRKDNFFSQYEVRVFEIIATYTTMAIANAEAYTQMEKMAITDGLTGLFNHRYFQESLFKEIERAERYNEKLSLLLIDIDHFKKINDTYGHPVGDKVLKEVAKILFSTIRTVDIAARYGGEEFAVILTNTGGKGALDTAERIRGIIEQHKFNIGNASLKVTASIGAALFPEDGGLPEDGGRQRLLISKADGALYLAKQDGRNRAYLYKDVAERIEDTKAM